MTTEAYRSELANKLRHITAAIKVAEISLRNGKPVYLPGGLTTVNPRFIFGMHLIQKKLAEELTENQPKTIIINGIPVDSTFE